MHRKTHISHTCAVALAAVQTLVIETASATGADVPARRPSPRVKLVPAGEFVARDGRPFGMQVQVAGADGLPQLRTVTARYWQLDNSRGWALADRLNARHNPDYSSGKPAAKAVIPATFGFDYEHQSLKSAQNGQPAPRSGSGSRFEWVYDDGLYITDVQWTPKAAQAILDGEYLYVSPVLFFDPDTGVVLDIFNAALVHTPALQELAGLQVTAADLSARLGLAPAQEAHTPLEGTLSLLDQLIARLGLPAGTTEAAALSAVATLGDKLSAVGTALRLDTRTADVGAIQAALSAATTGQAVAAALGAALQLPADAVADPVKATAAAVDLAARAAAAPGADAGAGAAAQAIAGLSAQVAALQAANAARDLDALIESGKAQGKIVPATEAWFRQQGVAALAAYLPTAPVVAPPHAGSQGHQADDPATGSAALGAVAQSVAAQFGLNPQDLA